jgi:hypothetical protein
LYEYNSSIQIIPFASTLFFLSGSGVAGYGFNCISGSGFNCISGSGLDIQIQAGQNGPQKQGKSIKKQRNEFETEERFVFVKLTWKATLAGGLSGKYSCE